MKLFKDNQNNIFAYELDGSQDHLIGNKTPITQEEANIIHQQKTQDELNKLTYGEKRAMAYKPIAEQLDMLYWDKINGTNNWETMITTVKNLYPKPTE